MSQLRLQVQVSDALLIPVISIYQLLDDGSLVRPELLAQLPQLSPMVIAENTRSSLNGDDSPGEDVFYELDNLSKLNEWLIRHAVRESGSERFGRDTAALIMAQVQRRLDGMPESGDDHGKRKTGMYL